MVTEYRYARKQLSLSSNLNHTDLLFLFDIKVEWLRVNLFRRQIRKSSKMDIVQLLCLAVCIVESLSFYDFCNLLVKIGFIFR